MSCFNVHVVTMGYGPGYRGSCHGAASDRRLLHVRHPRVLETQLQQAPIIGNLWEHKGAEASLEAHESGAASGGLAI